MQIFVKFANKELERDLHKMLNSQAMDFGFQINKRIYIAQNVKNITVLTVLMKKYKMMIAIKAKKMISNKYLDQLKLIKDKKYKQ